MRVSSPSPIDVEFRLSPLETTFKRSPMKRSIFVVVLVMVALLATVSAQAPARGQGGARPNIFAPAATANGPIADVMNSIVTAFNNRDSAYFEKLIAPDAVWLDEDGHHLLATVWMNRLLSANPARKLSITNLRTESWETAAGPASTTCWKRPIRSKASTRWFSRRRAMTGRSS